MIQVWRPQISIARNAHGPGGHLVAQDQQDIGSIHAFFSFHLSLPALDLL